MKHTSHTRAVRFLSSLLYFFSILIFINAFNFQHNPPGAWTYQSMNLPENRSLTDITFIDSLTGYATTSDGNGGLDTNFLLKTTDSGNNWHIIMAKEYVFQRVIFLNHDTGFVLHGDEILRTTNSAISWSRMPVPPDNFGFSDIFPLSWDTVWVCFPFIGGDFLYRTTNAGYSWTRQFQSSAIKKIYMYNDNFGLVGSNNSIQSLFRTTNSGINWTEIPGQNGFTEMFFWDSLTGLKTISVLRRTNTGGLSWSSTPMPSGGLIVNSTCMDFTISNADTLWGVGGIARFPNKSYRGILYRSINKGESWQYQIPDTSFAISQFGNSQFKDRYTGWMYTPGGRGIYTTIGGDTNFVTRLNDLAISVETKYFLFQNYPNPFNPKTIIDFELGRKAMVKLRVFDILGRQTTVIGEELYDAGMHSIEFSSGTLPSGIYFYSLYVNEYLIGTKRMVLLK
ncbi:MAG: T9SS type A sorting domain-containing protein [Ignavibacteria bacterium]|jgi:photosystem II stability/assembly factor-like uncharacterized protein|nr:T9SS type A sorting domain-containing protein [Ignavibacteria bacterium]MBK6878747.1 T9SS type A sorting domain-containing protein [Ignavibacteria bacterium]